MYRFIIFVGKSYEMSSFGENKTKKFVKGKLTDFIEYNKKQLSRIYPAGSRIHSSNYNPQMAWSAGCQIGRTLSVPYYANTTVVPHKSHGHVPGQ